MKVVNVLQVSALVSSSDDIKIRDGVTKNDDDDDDAFWRPKDERFPERNATWRRKSRQREKKRKEIGIARYLIRWGRSFSSSSTRWLLLLWCGPFFPHFLFCLVVVRNNCEEIRENAEEEKAAEEQKKEFFGFLVFCPICRTFSRVFLSLSLSFVSLIIISLFSGEKNTPTRIISLTRRACAEENSSQNCVLVVVINLSSFPSSSLDSFFSRGGVLWKKRETVTFIWDGRTRLWKTRSERWPVLLLLLQLIPQLLPFAVSIVLVHWGI